MPARVNCQLLRGTSSMHRRKNPDGHDPFLQDLCALGSRTDAGDCLRNEQRTRLFGSTSPNPFGIEAAPIAVRPRMSRNLTRSARGHGGDRAAAPSRTNWPHDHIPLVGQCL